MLRPSASLFARAVGAEVTADVGAWASAEVAAVRLDAGLSGPRRQAAALAALVALAAAAAVVVVVAAAASGEDTEEENRSAGSLPTYQLTG